MAPVQRTLERPLRRITIVGAGAAGKSTLARELAAILALPAIDLDDAIPAGADAATQLATVAALIRGEAWVLDGDHGASQPMRFAAADAVVFLDPPPLLCVLRALRRAVGNRGARRVRVAPGGPPPAGRWQTLRWLLRYRRTHRPRVRENLARHAIGKPVFVVTSGRDRRALLAEVRLAAG